MQSKRRCWYLSLQLEEVVLPGAGLGEHDDLAVCAHNGLASGVHGIEPLVQGLLHDAARRPPGVEQNLHVGEELPARQQHRLAKHLVLDVISLGLVPAGVKLTHTVRQSGGDVVLRFARFSYRHTVIDGIDVLHEIFVQFRIARIHQLNVLAAIDGSLAIGQQVLDNCASEVFVHQTSGGQLGLEAIQAASEGTLVVIIAVGLRVIHSSNIDNDVAFLSNGNGNNN